MDKRIIAIIGVGIIGAIVYVLMGSTPTSEGGVSAGGNGSSKKEEFTTEPTYTITETETTEPLALDSPVYNITLPAVVFPAPQISLENPWWLTSTNPPSEPVITKKSEIVRKTQMMENMGLVAPGKTRILEALEKRVLGGSTTQTTEYGSYGL